MRSNRNLIIKSVIIFTFVLVSLYLIANLFEVTNFSANDLNINEFFNSDDRIDSQIFERNSSQTLNLLRDKIKCDTKRLKKRYYQRGSFWVLENFIRAEHGDLECFESVTYVTHGDYTFLDNVPALVDRWRAPISIALYAPDRDFMETVLAIGRLRNCTENSEIRELIRRYVTFHLYFDVEFTPEKIPRSDKDIELDCFVQKLPTSFRTERKIFYPVNVGRNVARDAATTYFVLTSDIELYPSDNLALDFLEMIASEQTFNPRRIFPLAIYEVASNQTNPHIKSELQKMLEDQTAIRFHANICPNCHKVPMVEEWESTPRTTADLGVFTTVKRVGHFKMWEPIYIGTKNDPYYDERLTWEGKSDKMTQGYLLCVLNYSFALLDNAFLTHRAGIKSLKDAVRRELEEETKELIRSKIYPELRVLYGDRSGCYL